MVLPTSLLLAFALLGLLSLAILLVWGVPQLWHRIKHGRYKPTQAELENTHLRQMQGLEKQYLQQALEVEQERVQALDTQLKETLDKLVSRL